MRLGAILGAFALLLVMGAPANACLPIPDLPDHCAVFFGSDRSKMNRIIDLVKKRGLTLGSSAQERELERLKDQLASKLERGDLNQVAIVYTGNVGPETLQWIAEVAPTRIRPGLWRLNTNNWEFVPVKVRVDLSQIGRSVGKAVRHLGCRQDALFGMGRCVY